MPRLREYYPHAVKLTRSAVTSPNEKVNRRDIRQSSPRDIVHDFWRDIGHDDALSDAQVTCLDAAIERARVKERAHEAGTPNHGGLWALRGTTRLDFEALHGKPLVLIHGPTGGGKTAILDAMCYGLFGKTSGDERQGDDLRSDLADPGHLTRITFDFLHGDRLYALCASPSRRKKSRGEGFTEHKTRAWLWDQTQSSSDNPDDEGLLLAEKPTAVDAEVRAILGFTEEQFRQIVVLPQGKFRDFLKASAKDKESILKTLFGTSIHETITDELQKETRELEASFAANETRRKSILDERGVKTVEELQQLIESVAERIEPLKEEAKSLGQRAQEASAALERAENHNKQVDARTKAEARVKVLEAQASEISILERRHASIQAMKPILPVAEALDRAKQVRKAGRC